MDLDRDGNTRVEEITARLYEFYPSLGWSKERGRDGGYVVLIKKKYTCINKLNRQYQLPRSLRRWSAVVRLLGLWVRIRPEA